MKALSDVGEYRDQIHERNYVAVVTRIKTCEVFGKNNKHKLQFIFDTIDVNVFMS